MTAITDHAINDKWPAANPEQLQLYSFPTPNGIKVSACLEETGIGYEPHLVQLSETTSPEFLALNPNNKIPAIIDPDGPGGQPLALFESGAILIYLAEKSGKFLSGDAALRYETIQWVMFQMGGIGPMFGQLGFFHTFAGKDIDDPRPRQRYADETRRLLKVLDGRLVGRDWIVGEQYSIADMAIWPWIRALDFYGAKDLVGYGDLAQVERWMSRCLDRPASQAALNIPDKEG